MTLYRVDRLDHVVPVLADVVRRAAEIGPDMIVIEGLRTHERQTELYAQGRTAPGKIVTWTMQSKHLTGHAVDLGPHPLDWNNIAGFDAIANAMLRAASQLGVHLRYGGDWDGDGVRREKGETDSPHFELIDTGVLTA